MMIFVLGTPYSGKSAHAEGLVMERSADGPRYYVATLQPFGEEGLRRVQKHREMRKNKGFTTLECTRELQSICPQLREKPGTALLECVTNLVGNEIYAPEHAGWTDDEIVHTVLQEIRCLNEAAENLIAVSNDFSADPNDYDEETRRYIGLVHRVNEALKTMADEIHDITGGEWRYYDHP